MHTEKAVISVRFSSALCYNLFVYVLTAYTNLLRKTRNLQYTNRVNLSVFTVHLAETYKNIFTAIYRFHKINYSRHNNIMAFEIRYYNANS